ncbi:hypothetical protein [Streptomyces sp. PD-S100-1]|uniref:hypothetical protein n=1 Tax=Streptomyces sp. PD-S100-1 TaxID=3394351 RepID=UPI0039BC382A
MKTHISVQAAVVTMLVAKRPVLAKLPIRWELRSNGGVYVDLDLFADAAIVPQVAAEMARAIRGAKTNGWDIQQDDGTVTRAYQVTGQPSGVRVEFLAYQRGLRPDEVAALEGGDAV